jgi:hypothetical protein
MNRVLAGDVLVASPQGLTITLCAQFAQYKMDRGIGSVGISAVVRDGLLGGKPHGLIADHISIVGDESDFSLG